MKKSKKLYYALLSGIILFGLGCNRDTSPVSKKAEPKSYAEVNFTSATPEIDNPSGSSTVQGVALSATTGTFDEDEKAYKLSEGQSISFDVTASRPSMLQIAVEASETSQKGTFDVYLGGQKLDTMSVRLVYWYGNGTSSKYLFGIYQLDRSQLNSGQQTIKLVCNTSDVYVKNVKFLPRDLYSQDGELTTTLYTQFSETNQVGGTITSSGSARNQIWTRAYGLSEEIEMIPGPTLFFKPGDLVSVNIVNRLNQDSSDVLNTFEELQYDNPSGDEELAPVSLRGELNIPHNLNNTNLHVHGLHVDPGKDDVTIVIVPEGASDEDYDAPHSGHPVSSLDSLNEYSVADQSVKPGLWDYQYKIPETHLPGTHWFHPHKHGATSAQVENGLAGTLIIQETLENAVVSFSTPEEMEAWQNENDLVFSIQEISNYGLNLGEGDGQGSVNFDDSKIDLTVNGDNDLTFEVKKGQLQRWRLVNAGTNHRAFSHVWLGMSLGNEDGIPTYQSVPIYLVAVDGITLPEKNKVTASNPALLAPGNRSDFLAQLDQEGTYVLFKNYSLGKNTDIKIKDENGQVIYNSTQPSPLFIPAVENAKNNPFFFKDGADTTTYLGFKQLWKASNKQLSMVPLIRTEVINDQFLDVDFGTSADFADGKTGWQPVATGKGQIIDGTLFTVNVLSESATDSTSMPDDERLKQISAVGMGSNAPAYVSPIDPEVDVLQSRPIVFDVSGIAVESVYKAKKDTNNIRQFTLNGRFFILNDPVGNTDSDTLIQRPYLDPKDLEYDKDQPKINEDFTLEFVKSGGVTWPNTNQVGDDYYFTNPAYYQKLDQDNKTGAWTWKAEGKPSWELISGIPNDAQGNQRSSIINQQSKFYSGNENNLPNLPLAKTAEEWILINNSNVSHPFHIHINPFFVVEVGQLSYENGDWFMKAVTAEGEPQRPEMPATGAVPGEVYKGEISVDGIVGNWWDTIIVPAHGYVKVRYWFNVPNQTDDNGVISVADDFNKVGIWVYHCHILRHEDRGMMMPVITQKNKQ